jgi:RNA polymerase sigma-32 factor
VIVGFLKWSPSKSVFPFFASDQECFALVLHRDQRIVSPREPKRIEAQGMLAGPKLLAEKLNVREKDVIEMEQRLSGRGAEMSLDAPIEKDGRQTSHIDLLVDEHEGADEALARQQLLKLLEDRLPAFKKELNDREFKILQDRLLAEEPKTLQEVADLYGLTRERARQIEAKVISKLRDFLASDLATDI